MLINENRRPSGDHSRRYNSPVSDEIAVLMPNDSISNRDVVLHYRDGGLQHIFTGVMTHCSIHCFFHMVLMAGISNLQLQNGKN